MIGLPFDFWTSEPPGVVRSALANACSWKQCWPLAARAHMGRGNQCSANPHLPDIVRLSSAACCGEGSEHLFIPPQMLIDAALPSPAPPLLCCTSMLVPPPHTHLLPRCTGRPSLHICLSLSPASTALPDQLSFTPCPSCLPLWVSRLLTPLPFRASIRRQLLQGIFFLPLPGLG